jgi:hypothetical protein
MGNINVLQCNGALPDFIISEKRYLVRKTPKHVPMGITSGFHGSSYYYLFDE